MHSRITFLFVCISLAVDSAIALPIPALMRPSQFGAVRASHVILQEWPLLCLFISGKLTCPFSPHFVAPYEHPPNPSVLP